MNDPGQIRARFLALFGHGWQALFAEAAQVHPVTVSHMMRGARPIQPELVAHLEWLEQTPVAKWPERWIKLADLHRAKAKKARAA